MTVQKAGEGEASGDGEVSGLALGATDGSTDIDGEGVGEGDSEGDGDSGGTDGSKEVAGLAETEAVGQSDGRGVCRNSTPCLERLTYFPPYLPAWSSLMIRNAWTELVSSRAIFASVTSTVTGK